MDKGAPTRAVKDCMAEIGFDGSGRLLMQAGFKSKALTRSSRPAGEGGGRLCRFGAGWPAAILICSHESGGARQTADRLGYSSTALRPSITPVLRSACITLQRGGD